jgi:hypothetical protein
MLFLLVTTVLGASTDFDLSPEILSISLRTVFFFVGLAVDGRIQPNKPLNPDELLSSLGVCGTGFALVSIAEVDFRFFLLPDLVMR